MATISPSNVAAPAAGATADKTAELRERFTQFVGEAFFGQMIKAMRATTGKPCSKGSSIRSLPSI
jgi:hypothetical protein